MAMKNLNKLLVVVGTGLVGSVLAERLKQQEYDITLLVRNTTKANTLKNKSEK